MTNPLDLLSDVRPVSSVEAAATALREAIASGDLAAGERIKEIPVSERLGLGRTSVRDALRQLAEEGLVAIVPNQGASVASVGAQDLMELYAIRLSLGELAIRNLVHIQADLCEVDTQLKALEKAVARKSTRDAATADFALQDAMLRASGLERASTMFARTTLQLRAAIAGVGFDFTAVLRTFYDENAAVVAGLHAGDATAAARAWHDKLGSWVRNFVQHLNGDFDSQAWVAVYAPERREEESAPSRRARSN